MFRRFTYEQDVFGRLFRQSATQPECILLTETAFANDERMLNLRCLRERQRRLYLLGLTARASDLQ